MKCLLRITLACALLIGGIVMGAIVNGMRSLEYYGKE